MIPDRLRARAAAAGAFPAAARRLLRRAVAGLGESPWARRRPASVVECPHETAVFEAIAFGRLTAACEPELTRHAESCPVCHDLVEVARALHEDREALCREAHPPTAGMVWWRATIRARAEAAHTAMQPITWLQGIAGACVAGVTAALATIAWRSADAAGRLSDLVSYFAVERGGLASGFGFEHALIVLVGLAACLVLAPLALYFTLADD